MTVLIVIVHIIVSLIMIGVILLQAGKGAEIGAAFGGSSQTIFGSRGAATFLSKVTVASAVLFMLTSLSLTLLSNQRSVASIVDQKPPPPPASTETAPSTNATPSSPSTTPQAAQQSAGTAPNSKAPSPAAKP